MITNSLYEGFIISYQNDTVWRILMKCHAEKDLGWENDDLGLEKVGNWLGISASWKCENPVYMYDTKLK